MDSAPLDFTYERLNFKAVDRKYASELLALKQASWAELSRWGIWCHPPAPPSRRLEDEQAFCDRFHVRQQIQLSCIW